MIYDPVAITHIRRSSNTHLSLIFLLNLETFVLYLSFALIIENTSDNGYTGIFKNNERTILLRPGTKQATL